MTQLKDLDSLRSEFRGELVGPAQRERYDALRAVFNGMFDRRPSLIARPVEVSDVIAAIRFARERDLTIAVRGGGHSIAGYSTVDDGLVIDLGAMKRIDVDPAALRARAQAGLNWGEFDRATQEHGLSTTGGRVSTTGIAGLTLGSGSGWLERLHGLTCDNLVSAELVTADGRVVRASETDNSELLWGLRGGGGNFGIVTEFEYRLHPIGPTVLGGLLIHPRERAPELARLYRDIMNDAPDELGGGLTFITAPPAPFVPAELHGKPVVGVLVAWFGAIERGQQVLAPLRSFGPPSADVIQPLPYVALQSMLDAGNPYGRRCYWRAENLSALSDAALDAVIERAALATSPFTQMILLRCGGAIARVADDATAMGGRSASWQYHCYANWVGYDDQRHIDWVCATERALAPYALGRMSINFISDANSARVRAAFGGETYQRLTALKDAYDPDNVFRLNQNIQPSGS